MAKRDPERSSSPRVVTADRANRLYRLLSLLGQKPQTRAFLLRQLKLDVRGFYRDLHFLREIGVTIELMDSKYILSDELDEAVARLPFPDPHLTFQEGLQLAKGRTAAHQKLQRQFQALTGKPFSKTAKARKKS